MVSMCFLKLFYEHELQGTKITQRNPESSLGVQDRGRSIQRMFLCSCSRGQILPLSANRKVSHSHEAYHCPLCFLFPGSVPGLLPPRPLRCDLAQVQSPFSLRTHCLYKFSLQCSAPLMRTFPSWWMRFFFNGSLEKGGRTFYVAAPPYVQLPPISSPCRYNHRIKSISLSRDASRHIRLIDSHVCKKIRLILLFG